MFYRLLTGSFLIAQFILSQTVLAQDVGSLPDGPGANLVYAKCQQCHPINYVLESAGLPDFLWQDTLSLMKQLGMHVTEQEEQKLFEYLTTYLGTEPPPAPPADTGNEPEVDSDAIYAGSCTVCHGPEGQGGSDAFPPLSGHAAALAAADRDYLPLVVLYGLAGEILVDGETYNGVMPAWGQLTDREIAAVLNKITLDWDSEGALAGAGFERYTAEGIAVARGLGLSAAEVRERRPAEP